MSTLGHKSRFSGWPQPGFGLHAGHCPFLSLSLSLSSCQSASGHNTCQARHTVVTPCPVYFKGSTLEDVIEKIRLRTAKGVWEGVAVL